jgi:hypothetical protein
MLARVGDLGLVFGVAGAALLSGVVLMEAGLVAPLAVACAKSPACLSPEAPGWPRPSPAWAGTTWPR